MIAHYSFDKNFNDEVGEHNGKASGGVKIIKGSGSNGAAAFDGTGKIVVDAFRNFNWGSMFTVSVWFKRTGGYGNYQGIVNTGYYSSGSWEIRMGRELSGEMLGGGVVTKDSTVTWDYVNIRATKNQWHHVVMTYDGATLKFYLDNVKQSGKSSCCSGKITVKNTPLTIGQAGVGMSQEYFVGMIDSLRIYSKSLSPKEVGMLYSIGRGRLDCFSSTPSQYIACQTLLAYYPFDHGFVDVKGAHDGKSYGGAKISRYGGRFKGAAVFDGTGKIVVEAFRNFDWGSAFSVSVWFKRTGGFGNYQGIVNTGYYNNGNWEIRMGREMNGEMLGGGVITKNSPRTWDYQGIKASKNQWHHVVMTYDGSKLNFYLDNVKQSGKSSCCLGNIIVKNTPLTIGQAGVGMSAEYFVGMIDSLRLYSKALTASEVELLYNLENVCI